MEQKPSASMEGIPLHQNPSSPSLSHSIGFPESLSDNFEMIHHFLQKLMPSQGNFLPLMKDHFYSRYKENSGRGK